MNAGSMNILGIETSCDETAAAVYNQEKGLLSSALFSQIELHKHFGGVIPEVASRSQLEKINYIVQKALDDAQLDLSRIDAIAVTNKPGLPGSLLVGVCFAKAVAWAHSIPIIGINHLEGHAFSSFLEHTVPFPHLCLTASGGHTSLYLVEDFGSYKVLGETQDDAAGEAFDKIAKLLELGYPGGPIIEQLATEINFEDYYKYPRATHQTLNFSFSGLKTAVLYSLVKQHAYDMEKKELLDKSIALKQRVASSLLVCIADIFVQKLEYALSLHPSIRAISFVGGVACNKYIRSRIQKVAERHAIPCYVPSGRFCTDNAAMIAFVGNYKAVKNQYADLYLDILR